MHAQLVQHKPRSQVEEILCPQANAIFDSKISGLLRGVMALEA